MKLKKLLLIILVWHVTFVVQAQEFQEKSGTFFSLSIGYYPRFLTNNDALFSNGYNIANNYSSLNPPKGNQSYINPIALGVSYIEDEYHVGFHVFLDHMVEKREFTHSYYTYSPANTYVGYQEDGSYHSYKHSYPRTFLSVGMSYHLLWKKSFSDLSIRGQIGVNYNHNVRVESTLDFYDNERITPYSRVSPGAALYLQYKVMVSKNLGCLMAIGIGRTIALVGADYRTDLINY